MSTEAVKAKPLPPPPPPKPSRTITPPPPTESTDKTPPPHTPPVSASKPKPPPPPPPKPAAPKPAPSPPQATSSSQSPPPPAIARVPPPPQPPSKAEPPSPSTASANDQHNAQVANEIEETERAAEERKGSISLKAMRRMTMNFSLKSTAFIERRKSVQLKNGEEQTATLVGTLSKRNREGNFDKCVFTLTPDALLYQKQVNTSGLAEDEVIQENECKSLPLTTLMVWYVKTLLCQFTSSDVIQPIVHWERPTTRTTRSVLRHSDCYRSRSRLYCERRLSRWRMSGSRPFKTPRSKRPTSTHSLILLNDFEIVRLVLLLVCPPFMRQRWLQCGSLTKTAALSVSKPSPSSSENITVATGKIQNLTISLRSLWLFLWFVLVVHASVSCVRRIKCVLRSLMNTHSFASAIIAVRSWKSNEFMAFRRSWRHKRIPHSFCYTVSSRQQVLSVTNNTCEVMIINHWARFLPFRYLCSPSLLVYMLGLSF